MTTLTDVDTFVSVVAVLCLALFTATALRIVRQTRKSVYAAADAKVAAMREENRLLAAGLIAAVEERGEALRLAEAFADYAPKNGKAQVLRGKLNALKSNEPTERPNPVGGVTVVTTKSAWMRVFVPGDVGDNSAE